MEHVIDAKGKALGRVASEAAKILLGKHTTTVKRNAVAEDKVRITNASGLVISEKKQLTKSYHSHSGYPGSDKKLMLHTVMAKKGTGDALKRAIKGMLPPNTLRDRRMKHLTVEE